jgi:voltage-gated potassium channel
MRRAELVEILDGTHPTVGNGIALAHQGLIVLAGLALSIETVPDLPLWTMLVLNRFEIAVLVIFFAEYILRVVCADRPLRYIFSFWGLIDLLAWLPLVLLMQSQLAAIRVMRLMRLVRLFKLLHANRALIRFELALRSIRGELVVFAFLALIILYIAAVGIYIFEHEAQPEKFPSIPISLWWAIVSFTTVGYGDIYPITAGGRIFTSAVLFIGLGVIAVPTALISSALIRTDLTKKIDQTVQDDITREVRKELGPVKRKPTRR